MDLVGERALKSRETTLIQKKKHWITARKFWKHTQQLLLRKSWMVKSSHCSALQTEKQLLQLLPCRTIKGLMKMIWEAIQEVWALTHARIIYFLFSRKSMLMRRWR